MHSLGSFPPVLKAFGPEGWEWDGVFQEWRAGSGGELWVLSTHREPPRGVVTTAIHVLGEDDAHRPGRTTATWELCPHTAIQVVKIHSRGEGVCFPLNKQTNQPDLLVTLPATPGSDRGAGLLFTHSERR